MRVTVSVTQEHIDKGERAKCTACPVALALNEQIPGGEPWFVYAPDLHGGPDEQEFEAPASVVDFVERFDHTGVGGVPKPFTFELDVPVEWVTVP